MVMMVAILPEEATKKSKNIIRTMPQFRITVNSENNQHSVYNITLN